MRVSGHSRVAETNKYIKYVLKSIVHPRQLQYLILYVTSRCNSFCRTCYFHQNINSGPELSLGEYREISRTLGEVSVLLLSGGEPFLREDIFEICETFVKNNNVDTLSIPTNGLLPDRIVSVTERLTQAFPGVFIAVNPSLDGMEEYHDWVRGVKGGFSLAMRTIDLLCRLRARSRNLQVIINSVLNDANLTELKELAVYLGQAGVDYHALEILRGDWPDKCLRQPDIRAVKEMHDLLVSLRRVKLKTMIEKVAVIGALKYIYGIKERVLSNKRWPVPCAAGKSIAVLYPDGQCSACELRKPIANIRDFGYDIKKAMNSDTARKVLEDIVKSNCSCTHGCFINASLARDWRSYPGILVRYLRDD
jgi:Fe-coproporphyrin III synthase